MKLRKGLRVGVRYADYSFGVVESVTRRRGTTPLVRLWLFATPSNWGGWMRLDASHIVPFAAAARELRRQTNERIKSAQTARVPR